MCRRACELQGNGSSKKTSASRCGIPKRNQPRMSFVRKDGHHSWSVIHDALGSHAGETLALVNVRRHVKNRFATTVTVWPFSLKIIGSALRAIAAIHRVAKSHRCGDRASKQTSATCKSREVSIMCVELIFRQPARRHPNFEIEIEFATAFVGATRDGCQNVF